MERGQLTCRFVLLVEWLGQQRYANARGWHARIAHDLGMSSSYLSRILIGHRDVGIVLASRVASRVPIELSYFTDPELVAPARALACTTVACAEHGL